MRLDYDTAAVAGWWVREPHWTDIKFNALLATTHNNNRPIYRPETDAIRIVGSQETPTGLVVPQISLSKPNRVIYEPYRGKMLLYSLFYGLEEMK